jgi:hypothetical protein
MEGARNVKRAAYWGGVWLILALVLFGIGRLMILIATQALP